MASCVPKTREGEVPSPSSSSSSTSSDGWKERVFIPTLLAGIIGGGVGLVSRHRKVHVLSHISATYATNCAIVTGCYCGTREFVRVSRKWDSEMIFSSLQLLKFSVVPFLGVFRVVWLVPPNTRSSLPLRG